MTPARQRLWFWLLAAGLGLAAAIVLGAGLAWPVDLGSVSDGDSAPPETAGLMTQADDQSSPGNPSGAGQSSQQLEQLQRLASRPLRQPLYDEPVDESPGTAPIQRKPRSPMQLRLVGTIDEPGHAQAMFRMKDGRIELCGEGQTVKDVVGLVTVDRIKGRRVTVRYAGQSHDLVLEEPDLPG